MLRTANIRIFCRIFILFFEEKRNVAVGGCLYGSRRGTGTGEKWVFLLVWVPEMDRYEQAVGVGAAGVESGNGGAGARAVARNSAFSEREREGRGVPAGMTASV